MVVIGKTAQTGCHMKISVDGKINTFLLFNFYRHLKLNCPIRFGLKCENYDGIVSNLDLSSNNLNGSMCTEIGGLKGLTHIKFDGNQLSGQFPKEIANAQNLTHINLSNNKIFGSIPSQIKHVRLLEELILSSNQFTNTLPSDFRSLVHMKTLNLSNNSLTGDDISTILNELVNLRSLNISRNLFEGKIEVLDNIANLGKYAFDDCVQ